MLAIGDELLTGAEDLHLQLGAIRQEQLRRRHLRHRRDGPISQKRLRRLADAPQ